MVEVSIIIPIRFREDLTKVCIDSIINYTKDFELILVQEGEDEDLKRVMEEYSAVSSLLKRDLSNIKKVPVNKLMVGNSECIKYVQNKTPKGYSGALNTGLELATGKYICFMNNDTVAVPGWMDKMLKAFKECEDVGLVVPTFWGSGGRQSIEWGTEGYEYVDDYMNIIGVCFLMPREVVDKVGKWDESFFHGGEDFDMAYRIEQAGYNIVVARESFIYHYGGASTRKYFDNDLTKIRKNAMDKLKQFADKHKIPMEEIMEKINLSNNI